jgi:hypothetical protein
MTLPFPAIDAIIIPPEADFLGAISSSALFLEVASRREPVETFFGDA